MLKSGAVSPLKLKGLTTYIKKGKDQLEIKFVLRGLLEESNLAKEDDLQYTSKKDISHQG